MITGWLTALLGCVHYDLGEREEAETARRTAFEMGRQVGHGELMGWAHEMSAWFALVEGRYEDVVSAARMGQAMAGHQQRHGSTDSSRKPAGWPGSVTVAKPTAP